MDVISNCLAGDKKFSHLHVYLSQHMALENEEKDELVKLTKQ